ncbi:MAG: deaminase [Candidatus Falkowbacteria bacterium]
MEYLKGQQEKEATEWMEKAAEVAEKTLCFKAKCGTVIVKNGEIIGRGYNAPPLDKEENRTCNKEFGSGKPKYDKTCCIHAEWRAIVDALKRNLEKIKLEEYFRSGILEGIKMYLRR